jgi:hypothetical protein
VPSDAHAVFNFAFGVNSNSLIGFPKLRFIVKNILNTDYQPFGSYIPAMEEILRLYYRFTLKTSFMNNFFSIIVVAAVLLSVNACKQTNNKQTENRENTEVSINYLTVDEVFANGENFV